MQEPVLSLYPASVIQLHFHGKHDMFVAVYHHFQNLLDNFGILTLALRIAKIKYALF